MTRAEQDNTRGKAKAKQWNEGPGTDGKTRHVMVPKGRAREDKAMQVKWQCTVKTRARQIIFLVVLCNLMKNIAFT